MERDIPWFDPGMFEFKMTASGRKGNADGVQLNPPGSYRLIPDPEDLEQRGLSVEPREREVVLSSGKEPVWIYDVEFELKGMDAQLVKSMEGKVSCWIISPGL